ncbi:MAG: hypothetical protein E7389_01270 [Ruminococcaceae bacterium]|jgi:hypothetical protein|nr:hypothetical protein [Oscillospiraceae bacterium]
MDIYEFINSKAIKKHCQKIGHKFSDLEKAYLINQSHNHTVEEKCTAWQELLDTTDDFNLSSREHKCYDNLFFHELLTALIDYNKSTSEKFYKKGEKAVYQYSLYWNDWGKTEDEIHFDFEECYNKAFDYYKHEFNNNEIRDFCIMKKYTDGGEITLSFNSKQNGYEFGVTGMTFLEKEQHICYYLKMFWFYIPTPFQKGDILYDPDWNEVYVLKELYTDNTKRFSHWHECGDETDMYATCYLVNDNGNFGCDQIWSCLNLDYCDEDIIQGNKRILKLLGNYLKDSGSIPEDLLLNGYIRHLKENELNDLKIYNAYDWLCEKGLTE